MINLLKWFVLLSACLVCYVEAAELASCKDGELLCRNKQNCIAERYLCDSGDDCSDGSDEDSEMCEEVRNKRNFCSGGQILNSKGRCWNISEACRDFHDISTFCSKIGVVSRSPSGVIESLLKENSDLKNASLMNAASCNQDKKLKDLLVHLATSFNETLMIQNDSSSCPPLYVNIDGKCIALFSVAKVTWNEAEQFCESISGRLVILNKIQDYMALLAHLKLKELETDFWIGGYFGSNSTSSNSWMWLDQTDIVMGAPYWGLRSHLPLDKSCVKLGSFADCKYSMAPQENRDGFCLALDSKYHYYFSDQNCLEKRSPMCFLTKK